MNKRGPYRKQDPWLRIWSKLDPCRTDGCWIWTGKITRAGYGVFSYGVDATFYAHWIFAGQPLKGLHTDHVKAKGCTSTACICPEHLETVSPKENVNRGSVASYWTSKTHCKLGHPYSGENLRVYQGRRFCRACQRIKSREWARASRHQP